MLAQVLSVAHVGLESVLVEVEVDVASRGFPSFNIVGLPSKAIEEAKERVRTAIVNTGCTFPQKKITVNLAPADIPKEGSCYDLPITVGILVASGEIDWKEEHRKAIYYGELSLDGGLRHTKGVLLTGLYAKKCNCEQIFVSYQSAKEAAVVDGIRVMPVKSLKELIEYFRGERVIENIDRVDVGGLVANVDPEFDFADVLGQNHAKRALEIAAAGGHNLIMSGPPGSGKTMLAKALVGILPPLADEEALEVTRIYSSVGLIDPGDSLIRVRPFRNPHHSTSLVGLIGGGSSPQPGEVSLAHLGVMFLDEMAEFPRSVLEAMRQPIEDGRVVISRSKARVEYPAQFMLIAAVNPCPCGYLGHYRRECKCTVREIERYKRRISGPILDRIDLHVSVPAVDPEKFELRNEKGERSLVIRERVIGARMNQEKRYKGKNIYCNAQMKNKEVDEFVKLDAGSKKMMRLAVENYDLSARAYFRLLKVARTIADLDGVDEVGEMHLAEALQYRVTVF